jgi:hypothetical protein
MPRPPVLSRKISPKRPALAATIAALCALSVQAETVPAPVETSAPITAGRTATVNLEAQIRSEASNFTTRLALPIVSQRTSATLVQVNAAKGAEDLGTIGGGLVQRFRPYGGEWVFGLYGFYELRESRHGADFQLASFGVEVSRGRHTVRANGWVPTTGGESQRHGRDTTFTGPTAGFDVEYELALPSPGLHLQPHVAAGYYDVEGTHGVGGKESGVKLRADVQYRWVTAGVEWRDDDRAFGGNWLGTIRVTVPFGGSAGPGGRNDARMVEPIRRDSWPGTFEHTKHAPAPHRHAAAIKPPTSVVQPVTDQDCCNGAPSVIIYD